MRVLVTGGRNFNDRSLVETALSDWPHDAVLVHGAARGLDSMAAEFWRQAGRKDEPHPAEWSALCRKQCKPNHRRSVIRSDDSVTTYCPAAGVWRNQEMLDSGVDILIAFPGGNGTADMVKRATKAGIPVLQAVELREFLAAKGID